MWDWSTSKTPAPVGNARDDRAQQAQSQGVTPVRRDVRPVPVYRDPRPSWTPQQPAPVPQGYAPQPMPQQPYVPQPVPQQYAPQPMPQQPYAPQPVMQQAEQPVPAARPAVPTVDSAYNVTKIPRPVETTGDRADWEYQLTQLDLPNMELQEVNFVMLNSQWKLELRKAFKRARRERKSRARTGGAARRAGFGRIFCRRAR